MADRTYTQEEVNKMLQAQVAQLAAGLLGHRDTQFAQGPLDQPTQGPIAAQYQQQYGGGNPGVVQIPPQGFTTLPGAGAFAPSGGVLFAGGSPWPVSARPAQMANIGIAANQFIDFLRQSGLADKGIEKLMQVLK